MASYSTFIYQSSNSASGTQGLAHGWDYTAGSGDLVGQANDISTGTVRAVIAVDTDGTLYVLDRASRSTTNKLFGFYPTGAQTANIMDIDRTHSFPLGTRQASTYGFGYDETNDRFLVPNVNRVNTYDKAVVSAARSYQPFSLMGIPRATDIGPVSFVVKGDRAFLFGEDDPTNDYDLTTVKIYSWPSLRFIQRRNVPANADRAVINLNGRIFGFTSISGTVLREISLASFEYTGTLFSLLGKTGTNQFIYEDAGTLYAKGEGDSIVRAYSAAGTTNKVEITSKRIILQSTSRVNHIAYKSMFGDADNFYFGRRGEYTGSYYPLVFDAYTRQGGTRNASADLSFNVGLGTESHPWIGTVVIDSIVYISIPLQGLTALVKAV